VWWSHLVPGVLSGIYAVWWKGGYSALFRTGWLPFLVRKPIKVVCCSSLAYPLAGFLPLRGNSSFRELTLGWFSVWWPHLVPGVSVVLWCCLKKEKAWSWFKLARLPFKVRKPIVVKRYLSACLSSCWVPSALRQQQPCLKLTLCWFSVRWPHVVPENCVCFNAVWNETKAFRFALVQTVLITFKKVRKSVEAMHCLCMAYPQAGSLPRWGNGYIWAMFCWCSARWLLLVPGVSAVL